jgi:hypothetical protein
MLRRLGSGENESAGEFGRDRFGGLAADGIAGVDDQWGPCENLAMIDAAVSCGDHHGVGRSK